MAYGPEKIVRSIRLGPAWQSWTKPHTSFGAFGSRYGKTTIFARGSHWVRSEFRETPKTVCDKRSPFVTSTVRVATYTSYYGLG